MILQNTKYEDLDKIIKLSNAETMLNNEFQTFHTESVENYKRLAGNIFSTADKTRLKNEGRFAHEYNLFLPIVLQLVGNIKNTMTKLEAVPRESDDFESAKLFTKLLDYTLYSVNDFDYALAKAMFDAIVGRIGWVTAEWSYRHNPKGDVRIRRYVPWRIKFDTNVTQRDFKDCNYLTDTAWYTPEEIAKTFAFNDAEMWQEIMEKSRYYIQPDERRKNGMVSFIERIWGNIGRYLGREQGYDAQSQDISDITEGGEWVNSERGLFKVIEYHERRSEMKYTLYEPTINQSFDITGAISAKGKEYDNDKLQALRKKYRGAVIKASAKEVMYQVNTIPALFMKVYDKPYPIQNGYFKYTPIWALDFGATVLDNKGIVDHIIDPVSSYNKRRNSILEYLVRLSTGETWVEEDALGEYEEEFLEHEIGGVKHVKPGALSRGKVIRQNPAPFPQGLAMFAQEDMEDTKYITGIRDNAQGGSENANESGKLFQLRVHQSNVMQAWLVDNLNAAQKQIGANVKDIIQKYMTDERVFRISEEEKSIVINKQVIGTKINDISVGKYDIIISKAPYGAESRYESFNQLLMLNQQLAQLDPEYIDPELLIRQAPVPYKAEMLKKIRERNQERAMQRQQEATTAQEAQKAAVTKAMGEAQKATHEAKKKELEVDNQFLANAKTAEELAINKGE